MKIFIILNGLSVKNSYQRQSEYRASPAAHFSINGLNKYILVFTT